VRLTLLELLFNYAGGIDAFITKVNPAGSGLVYSTYFGGSDREEGQGIAADNNGNAYVVGITSSNNLPLTAPFQSTIGGGSAVYVAGSSASTNFPTATPLQVANGGGDSDAFITKIIPGGPQVKIAETLPHTGAITHTATSTDAKYNGASVSFTVNGTAGNTVNANITDNDAGVSLTPITANATEGGATGSYTVKLNTQPIAPVTINLVTGTQIKPIAALTFTPNNWNVAQTVRSLRLWLTMTLLRDFPNPQLSSTTLN
jgi:large repetitive protein